MSALGRSLLCCVLLTSLVCPLLATDKPDDYGINITVLNYGTGLDHVYLGDGWNVPQGVARMEITVTDEPGFIYIIESRHFVGATAIEPGRYPARWQKHHTEVGVGTLVMGKVRITTFKVVGKRAAR
jgi:hypothetical protein